MKKLLKSLLILIAFVLTSCDLELCQCDLEKQINYEYNGTFGTIMEVDTVLFYQSCPDSYQQDYEYTSGDTTYNHFEELQCDKL